MIPEIEKQVLNNARDICNDLIKHYDALTPYEVKSKLNLIQCMIFDVIEINEVQK
jgi:hypothetical protein